MTTIIGGGTAAAASGNDHCVQPVTQADAEVIDARGPSA
eukprot:COSAG06_NODE_75130_length_134_cov_88.085714_1_plen_38_part_10